MLLGALIFLSPREFSNAKKTILSTFGLVLIGASTFFANSQSWPGWQAIFPVAGACAIIYANDNSNRLFSLRAIQWLGLTSYSLYLWHWPVVVALNSLAKTDWVWTTVGVALSVLAGFVCYALIETPARKWNKTNARWLQNPGMYLAAVPLILLGTGSLMYAAKGFPGRLPTDVQEILAYARPASGMRAGQCFLTTQFHSDDDFKKDLCISQSPTKPNVLIVGDSHAAHLWSGLSQALPAANVMQATASGCKPVLNSRGAERCTRLMDYMMNNYLPNAKRLDKVILSARWMPEDIDELILTANHIKKFTDELVVFGPIVEYTQDLPTILARERFYHVENMADRYRNQEKASIDAQFSTKLQMHHIKYVSIYRAVCPTDRTCSVLDDQKRPLQFDYGHLTNDGSAVIAKRIVEHWPVQ